MLAISVIICVHNQKYELRKSLESLKAQTMQPEEVIIVDYSSDDSCQKFFESCIDCTASDIRYVFIPQKNEEPFDDITAFETGLKYASGEYSAFLVAGDTWNNEKLAFIKDYADKNQKKDFILTSYKKYVGFEEKTNLVNEASGFADGIKSLFMFWYAPSTVVMKTQTALALKSLSASDFEQLNVGYVLACLATVFYGVDRDSLIMEKLFWNKFYPRITELNVVQEAALFCIREYQNDVKTKESLELLAKTVELQPDDVVKVVFGIKEFTQNEIDLALYTGQINRKQQNYLLMRKWLEMKISGRSVAQNLREKSISSIAIYGAGKHGSILFNDLKSSDIKILAWIDNNPKESEILGCPVYKPADFSQKKVLADAIIVTPYLDFVEIKKDLSGLSLSNIISLEDIIK